MAFRCTTCVASVLGATSPLSPPLAASIRRASGLVDHRAVDAAHRHAVLGLGLLHSWRAHVNLSGADEGEEHRQEEKAVGHACGGQNGGGIGDVGGGWLQHLRLQPSGATTRIHRI